MTWSMFEFASLIFLGLGLAFLLIAIVLFFVWRIPSVYADVKGKTVVHDVARSRAQHGRTQNMYSRRTQQDVDMENARDYQSSKEMATRISTRVETHPPHQSDNSNEDAPTTISLFSKPSTENS
ncbi:MAG: hypothetical protein IKZ87_07135 [Actinomycetaceae bacterium]|nr:hypothetical protein [Actinomycetaceae bacterium]